MKLSATLLSILALTLTAIGSQAATISFTVAGADGKGDITGFAGQITGYDFTFANNSSYVALLDDSQLNFSSPFAIYTDFIASSAPEVGAKQTLTQSFSYIPSTTTEQATDSGLGAFLIDSNATPGETIKGTVSLTYDLYYSDPNTDPGAIALGYGYELTAPISLTVGNSAMTAVPEPSLAVLVGSALVLGYFGLKRGGRAKKTKPPCSGRGVAF